MKLAAVEVATQVSLIEIYTSEVDLGEGATQGGADEKRCAGGRGLAFELFRWCGCGRWIIRDERRAGRIYVHLNLPIASKDLLPTYHTTSTLVLCFLAYVDYREGDCKPNSW